MFPYYSPQIKKYSSKKEKKIFLSGLTLAAFVDFLTYSAADWEAGPQVSYSSFLIKIVISQCLVHNEGIVLLLWIFRSI